MGADQQAGEAPSCCTCARVAWAPIPVPSEACCKGRDSTLCAKNRRGGPRHVGSRAHAWRMLPCHALQAAFWKPDKKPADEKKAGDNMLHFVYTTIG